MSSSRAIAIVGLGCILPDALDVQTFWNNILGKRYSITETPPERWSLADYYDPDPTVPDKTYSKIGGWVRGFEFDWKRYKLPPKVVAAMDQSQQWAVTIAAQALADYGYPERSLDTDRTGVILGTAMGGELHYLTNLRIMFPEFAHALEEVDAFGQLPAEVRQAILAKFRGNIGQNIPPITEDSMPGELPNVVAGRVANLLNLRGPSFITDAACASALAALDAACELLIDHEADAVLTGGVDRNMGVSTFVKFCKIGALSATGTRPFGAGADGFVMGEGAGAFLLKRLADAEQNGDKIYAVIRGVGGASDGKGKGITAPNPLGQQLAMRRAWEAAELDPATATLVEAHGTSTKVGDVVEVESLANVFGTTTKTRIALGSVKSNLGHLKAGAGAAGLLKATLALHHKVLPPTLNAHQPNPNIPFDRTPFYLNHETQEWAVSGVSRDPRRAAVSAYGFGGTNFHVVLEEHQPGALTQKGKVYTGATTLQTASNLGMVIGNSTERSVLAQSPITNPQLPPFRGILALGAPTAHELKDKLDRTLRRVQAGWTPPISAPDSAELRAAERLVIDYGEHTELQEKLLKAQKSLGFDTPQAWKPLAAQGIFRGSGAAPGKIAFLFPGQGSQYLNMGRELAQHSATVAQVFQEADAVMTPILKAPLTQYLFAASDDPAKIKAAEQALTQTAITQPAMLTLDTALYKLLGDYGFAPDMVMGHSLGEYAALIAAGVMPFAHALEAAAARGAEMTKVSVGDNGWMAAVMAPLEIVEKTLKEVDGYVVAANLNSRAQAVIGGESKAVEKAIGLFLQKGYQAMRIPVSHAFHTRIVAPASKPLRQVLNRLTINSPRLPLVANVTGQLYPTEVEAIKDLLEQQIAAPVQWIKGLETLYAQGVRTFVEVGPKKALKGFVDDVLGTLPGVVSLFTNHPKSGELASFNQALCGLYAAGYGGETRDLRLEIERPTAAPVILMESKPMPQPSEPKPSNNAVEQLGQLLAQALSAINPQSPISNPQSLPFDRNAVPLGSLVISGTGLGLPGTEKSVMAEDNAQRILRGEQFVDLIPERFRNKILHKRITRLVKSEDGSGRFETIVDPSEVLKLAGRPGAFNLTEEYGVPEKLVEALDTTTQLAMAAGLDALREAGIPLVQTWKKTTTGKYLPDRWLLPPALRDETGVIFASAFPGGDRFADEFERYYTWQNRQSQLTTLEDLRLYTQDPDTLRELNRRISDLREALTRDPYEFDRRFLFRILAMGHSQFAEYIGARGPNTHVNAACASTAQGIAIAEDWLRSGRCRRVIVIGADNVTGEHLMEWVGAGFLATGAAATDDRVEEAALPFDRRRHGTLLGMGACALVVESEDAVRERGMRGIVELLSSETNNSAYHGTRLDVAHIGQILNNLITAAERRFGLHRHAIAPQTVFMSHETFTPARGGSAAAEVMALRHTFGDSASDIIMANTKGFTGHPMGVGVEDVIAVKILEYGVVPPVPNFKEVDPDLGPLNLSRGGRYPVQYAIHLAAGFGSQIALTFTRRIPGALNRVDNSPQYQRWLADVSGYDTPNLETVKRVLRLKSVAPPQRQPQGSPWQPGTGPTLRAAAPGHTPQGTTDAPARMKVSPQEVKLAPAPEPVKVIPVAEKVVASVVQDSRAAEKQKSKGVPEKIADSAVQNSREAETQRSGAVESTPPPLFTSPSQPSTDPVVEAVLTLVSTKTGYPRDMLDLDLDMEADLGIDTVKQAETFAAIREQFGIPRRDDLKLRDYNTLAKVVQFVRDSRPDLASSREAEKQRSESIGPATPPLVIAASQPSTDPVIESVLTLVSTKTGYPRDMLDLDLDMEADLGIDTVKQAETFAAIREQFGIPRRDDLKLRDYNTLAKVVGFVRESRPDLAVVQGSGRENHALGAREQGSASVSPLPPSTPASLPATDPVIEAVLTLVSEKTGYPRDMLDLDLDMEADLGIDTVKQAETFAAIREQFGIPRRDDLKLRDYNTLAKVVQFVRDSRPDLAVVQGSGRENHALGAREQGSASVSPLPPSTPAPLPATDPVIESVLTLVSDKTGYPRDMLDLDLDMEADLGIDTVKQAETFAAIREQFGIPRRDDLKLRDYNTLAKVVGFVYASRPDLKASAASDAVQGRVIGASDSPLPPSTQGVVSTPAPLPSYSLAAADTFPRRIPTPALRPPLEMCKPTGVTLEAQSRVIVMLDKGGVGKSLVNRLQKRGVTVLTLEEAPTAEALDAQLVTWLAAGPIQGVYWLPALDVEPALEALDLATWRELNRVRVKNLYRALRALYASISGPGTFLVAATRLGGLHGYGEGGASAPLGGAVTGFVKAYKRERPNVTVKAVDFEISRKTADPADILLAETLSDPGVVEVGYWNEARYTVTLTECPAQDGLPGLPLNRDTVFLITGAAGGITSAITADLAAHSGGKFYLLDLVPLPAANDPHIALFRQDKDALKQMLIDEAKAAGERPTPVLIDKKLLAIERAEAALRAKEAVEATGGTAHYFACDLRDAATIRDIVANCRTRYGRIDVLLHAGGLEISRALPDKDAAQFDLVFDVKADGFFNLLKAAQGLPIGATVAFSSVAGRFGNSGQTDYSAANDLLCKITTSLRQWRPETRGIVIDWTAWGGIGMATRGSIPKIMELAGIEMLTPEAGIPTVRRELTVGGYKGEVLVGGKLGLMMAEFDPTGGLDPQLATQVAQARKLLMVGQVKAALLYGGLDVETTLDPTAQPFLYDHALDGTPLLPGVMGTEAFAQLATLLAPGYGVAAIENENFESPFKFYRNQARTLYLNALITPTVNGRLCAHTTLRSLTALPNNPQPKEKVHFTATVALAPSPLPPCPSASVPATVAGVEVSHAALYKVYFHGPAYQVLQRAVVQGDVVLGEMTLELPPNTNPADATSVMAPRLIELCFQTAGVWEMQTKGVLALPLSIESVTTYAQPAPDQPLRAYVQACDNGTHFDAQVVDDQGQVYVALKGYRTVQLPGQVNL